MKMNPFRRILISTLGLCTLPYAFHSEVLHADSLSGLEGQPLRIFGSAAAGVGNVVSAREYSGAPGGYLFALGGSASYQMRKWVFETGGGWNYTRLSGNQADSASILMRTRSGFADASARYRLGPNWQLGPVYTYQFGTDTRLGPNVGAAAGLSLYGVRVGYETALGKFPVRLFMQGMSNLGASGRDAAFATLGFQVGIPIQMAGGPRPFMASRTHSDSLGSSQASPKLGPNDVRAVLDVRKVFFATDSSHVRTKVEGMLRKLGGYLRNSEAEWEILQLSGHADIRGTWKYNQALSRRRSESVRAVLAAAGVDARKLKVAYHSFDRPEDPGNTPDAWAKNRRVELIFRNVKNVEALTLKLKELAPLELPGEEW